jgi:hypothetical protein
MFGLDFMALESLLPFMLVVAIVYGALETVRMFKSKGVKVVIAVVLGFFSIMNSQVVETINTFLPFAAIAFVFIFLAGYMKKSMSGGEKDNTMLIIMVVLGLLFSASLFNAGGAGSLYQYTDFLWFTGALAVIAILYAAYKMK